MCVNNAWGAVCDSGWDVTDGNVLCAQLGFQALGQYYYYVSNDESCMFHTHSSGSMPQYMPADTGGALGVKALPEFQKIFAIHDFLSQNSQLVKYYSSVFFPHEH